jgi:ABC-type sugar transport system permease subunit
MKIGPLKDSSLAFLLIFPLIVLGAALFIYPLAYSFYLSLNDINPVLRTFNFVGFEQYQKALSDPDIANSAFVSISFVVIVTILCLSIGILVALLLNESFHGRTFVRTIVILPWAISEFIVGVVWRFSLNDTFGPLNGALFSLGLIPGYRLWLTEAYALLWVALAYTWHIAPIGVYFFLGALQTVPEPLYNAAKVEGANAFRRFRLVTIPYLRYPFLIVLVLTTLQAVTAWDIFYVITYGGPGTSTESLTFQIFRQQFEFGNIGYASSISYILIISTVVVSMVYFRLLTRRSGKS